MNRRVAAASHLKLSLNIQKFMCLVAAEWQCDSV